MECPWVYWSKRRRSLLLAATIQAKQERNAGRTQVGSAFSHSNEAARAQTSPPRVQARHLLLRIATDACDRMQKVALIVKCCVPGR